MRLSENFLQLLEPDCKTQDVVCLSSKGRKIVEIVAVFRNCNYLYSSQRQFLPLGQCSNLGQRV